MRIGKPVVERNGDHVEYSAAVHGLDAGQQLKFRIPAAHEGLVSERADAALVGLILPAMRAGCDIHVEGPVSPRLHYTLSSDYQDVMSRMMTGLRRVKITANHLEAAQSRPSGVATGFSGGVDSYSVLARHEGDGAPKGFRLTHLLFNNVGSHGRGKQGDALFARRFKNIAPAGEATGLPFVPIDSNLDSFYNRLGFQATHTTRNAAVALLLQAGIGRLLYASAYSYGHVGVQPTNECARADPIVLPLLSTETVDLLSADSGVTRVEKTVRLGEVEKTRRYLDICVVETGRNCSACWKCKRTLLTLEIAGLLDEYADVFDLDTYAAHRSRYLREVAASDDPLLKEVADYAAARGFSLAQGNWLLMDARIQSEKAVSLARRCAGKLLRR